MGGSSVRTGPEIDTKRPRYRPARSWPSCPVMMPNTAGDFQSNREAGNILGRGRKGPGEMVATFGLARLRVGSVSRLQSTRQRRCRSLLRLAFQSRLWVSPSRVTFDVPLMRVAVDLPLVGDDELVPVELTGDLEGDRVVHELAFFDRGLVLPADVDAGRATTLRALSFRVDSKFCPFRSTVHFQVPVGSAARAGVPSPSTTRRPKAATHHHALVRLFIAISPDARGGDLDAGGSSVRTGPEIDTKRPRYRTREIVAELPRHDAEHRGRLPIKSGWRRNILARRPREGTGRDGRTSFQ